MPKDKIQTWEIKTKTRCWLADDKIVLNICIVVMVVALAVSLVVRACCV